MSEITPAQIAAALEGVDDVNEVLNGWVDVSASNGSNVARVTFTPVRHEPGQDNVQHFRAVVVEGETAPIVLDRATFEQRVNERFDAAIRKLGCESLTFVPATIAALRAQILALDVDLTEAVQAEQTDGAL